MNVNECSSVKTTSDWRTVSFWIVFSIFIYFKFNNQIKENSETESIITILYSFVLRLYVYIFQRLIDLTFCNLILRKYIYLLYSRF